MFTASFAAVNTEAPVLKAHQLFFPVGKNGEKISYAQLATISIADLQALTGKRMGFFQRMNFRMAQLKIRKSIAPDGTIRNKKVARFFTAKGRAGETGFHIGGFALGFFVGLIGVLIAYLIKDDFKRNRVKWAWIGYGIFVAIYLVLLLTVLEFNTY
jgi:hypothetical protein